MAQILQLSAEIKHICSFFYKGYQNELNFDMEQWTRKIGLTQLNSEQECSETRIQLHLLKMVFYILSIAKDISTKARGEPHILSETKDEVDLL